MSATCWRNDENSGVSSINDACLQVQRPDLRSSLLPIQFYCISLHVQGSPLFPVQAGSMCFSLQHRHSLLSCRRLQEVVFSPFIMFVQIFISLAQPENPLRKKRRKVMKCFVRISLINETRWKTVGRFYTFGLFR